MNRVLMLCYGRMVTGSMLLLTILLGACQSNHDDPPRPPVESIVAPQTQPLPESPPKPAPPTLLWRGAIDDERDELQTSLHRPREPIPAVLQAPPTGEERFIGRVDEPGKEGRVHVAAFRASDAMPEWLSAPLDVLSEEPRGIVMALEGTTLAVTTADKRVLLMDAQKGTILTQRGLEMRAIRICRPKPGLLRVDEADGHAIDIKVIDRTFSDSKSTCDDLESAAKSKEQPQRFSPYPKGYSQWREVAANGARVARGQLDGQWQVLGLDPNPSKPNPLWIATPGDGEPAYEEWNDLFWSDGHDAITEYQRAVPGQRRGELVGTGVHVLTAFNVKTGKELWRTTSEQQVGNQLGIEMTSRYIYVARYARLEVFTRAGQLVGYVGWH